MSEAWEDYRKRRNLPLFAFIGYLPIVGTVGFLLTLIFRPNNTPLILFGGCWMAFFAIAAIRFQMFECPSCGKAFFAKWWYHNIFAQRCVHCGLCKYATTDCQLKEIETAGAK